MVVIAGAALHFMQATPSMLGVSAAGWGAPSAAEAPCLRTQLPKLPACCAGCCCSWQPPVLLQLPSPPQPDMVLLITSLVLIKVYE
jgi:hypothetical protein